MDLKRIFQSSAEDQPALAIALMQIGLVGLSLQDALGKMLTSELSLWQFQSTRAMFNIVFVLALAWFTMRGFRLLPNRLAPVFCRSLLHVCALMFFFGGAPFLTMAEMAGGLYTFPLFVALLSAVFLREQVGVRRIMAIVFGFAGTLLILKPGTDAFRVVGLMPVAAAFSYSVFIIVTRRLCRNESPLVLTLFSNFTILTVGLVGSVVIYLASPGDALRDQFPFLLSNWFEITYWILGMLLICAIFNVIGNICLSKAYQSAESSFLAPFDYSYLIFASFWGVVFWGDFPGPLTLAGMGLIAASGIYVAWRERQIASFAGTDKQP